jgi:hypothetical protein
VMLGQHPVLAGECDDIDVVDGQAALLENGAYGERRKSAIVLDAIQALLGDAGKYSGRIAQSSGGVVGAIDAESNTSFPQGTSYWQGIRLTRGGIRPIDAS